MTVTGGVALPIVDHDNGTYTCRYEVTLTDDEVRDALQSQTVKVELSLNNAS